MASNFIAFHGGRWISQHEVRIEIDDLGFFQGVTAVERLRTWQRKLPPLSEHIERFANSIRALRLAGLPAAAQWQEIISELLDRNAFTSDVGITLFATPGRRGEKLANYCAHLTTLNLPKITRMQQQGQPLIITGVQQPASACWSRAIKVRSRLHYYLADLEASDRVEDGLGLLLDSDGSITETSTSNVIVRQGMKLIMPPEDRVLPGVMAKRVCELAIEEGYRLERRLVMPEELRGGQEVWLTGSEVGLWYASQIDGRVMTPADGCLALQTKLFQRLGAGK